MPFLVSRQVFAGAGKVGIEAQESGFRPGALPTSQRADFIETELSVDTMHNRPILNTRDEPHADRADIAGCILILGDANMCEYATALKVGTTRLVLELIERGKAPHIGLDDPVLAVKEISRDPYLKVAVRLDDGSICRRLICKGSTVRRPPKSWGNRMRRQTGFCVSGRKRFGSCATTVRS